MKAATATQPMMLKPFGYPVFVFNTAEGVSKNLAVRKAIRQALSMEDMLAAAFGSKDFYALDGASIRRPITGTRMPARRRL
jgi:peptide/nickel transport system substrate-binding protein